MAFASPVNFSSGIYGFGFGSGGYGAPQTFGGGYGSPYGGGAGVPGSFGGYGGQNSFGVPSGLFEFGYSNAPGASAFSSFGNYGSYNGYMGNFTGGYGNNELNAAYGMLNGSGLLQGYGLHTLSPTTLGANSMGLLEFT
ncbi:MAG TPA: hypothetical protein VGO93_21815 [Candidatus Xenobia bacterium]|jgi:hypothetical protein